MEKELKDKEVLSMINNKIKRLKSAVTIEHVAGYNEALEDVDKYVISLIAQSEMSYDENKKGTILDCLYKCCDNGVITKEQRKKCIDWLDKQGEQRPTNYSLEQAAGIFLEALSLSPYNNKPITDAQIITKELMKFLSDASSYNPDALNKGHAGWSDEDETTKNNISHIIRQYDKIRKKSNQPCYYVGDCLLWMQNIKERVQPKPKHGWSEEDEDMRYKATAVLNRLCAFNEDFVFAHSTLVKVFDWLNSLKCRCQPQPQKKWSEEDEKMYDRIIRSYTSYENRILNARDLSEDNRNNILEDLSEQEMWLRDRLKSLRPQKQWTPSEELLAALYRVIPQDVKAKSEDEILLGQLYQELKKLREDKVWKIK